MKWDKIKRDIKGIEFEISDKIINFDEIEDSISEEITEMISELNFLWIEESKFMDFDLAELDYSNIHNPKKEKLIIFQYIESEENYILGFMESDFKDLINKIEEEN